jgi:hypothetical protein
MFSNGLFVLKYLSLKQGSLFVLFVFMSSTERTQMLQIVFSWCLWKGSRRGGVHGLGSMTFGLAVQKFLNIE